MKNRWEFGSKKLNSLSFEIMPCSFSVLLLKQFPSLVFKHCNEAFPWIQIFFQEKLDWCTPGSHDCQGSTNRAIARTGLLRTIWAEGRRARRHIQASASSANQMLKQFSIPIFSLFRIVVLCFTLTLSSLSYIGFKVLMIWVCIYTSL